MRILLDYTLHNREIIEISDEEWKNLGPNPETRKDAILDAHLNVTMGLPVVDWEFSYLDCEAFEPLSD